MSIVVNMACGLANRMFQYSFYKYLKSKGYDVKVDYFTTKRLAHEEVDWEKIFPAAKLKKASKIEIWSMGGGKDILSKIIRKFLNSLTKVTEMPSAYSLFIPKHTNENRYLLGVFQNATIAEAIEMELKRVFQFQPFKDNMNIELAARLQNENSVAIHVRKGSDYQSRVWYRNTCPSCYYSKAVKWIKNNVKDPVFYVFTDNPDWVRENFKDFKYTVINHNPISGWGSHFDMQLMSLCRHNIISNSTYSWWGAFLNSNSDKIVIIPEVWFNPEATQDYYSQPLRCKGWITI